MDTTPLPGAIEAYLASERSDLVGFAETLVGHDTQNPPGRTVAVADWLAETLAGAGIDVDRVAVTTGRTGRRPALRSGTRRRTPSRRTDAAATDGTTADDGAGV